MVEADTRDAAWDPLSLTYAVEGREVELPLRLLLVGRLTARGSGEGRATPVPVPARDVDSALRELAPRIEVTVPDRLTGGSEPLALTVDVHGMDDFLPGRLATNLPPLARMAEVMSRLRAGEPVAEAGLRDALTGLEEGAEADTAAWRQYAIAELNGRLARQIDEILHHPAFQEVEANWRNVAMALAATGDDARCRIDLLDIGRDELLEDFRAAAGLEHSLLYQTVYTREFGQYGGEPYAALVGAYEFGPGAADVELLRHVAAVCARAHAPFIAGGAPALLGLRRFEELGDASSLLELRRAPRFARWRSLLDDPDTRYIGLTMPRVLLRRPHRAADDPDAPFSYREDVTADRANGLWSVAAFAFVGCLVRSFRRYAVCVDVTGPEGGRLDGLPELAGERDSTWPGHPIEVVLSERKEAELTELGFMPVAVARARDAVLFNAAASLHAGSPEAGIAGASERETLGLRLGVQLPYVFLVSRIAHYLKVIQRDMIGTQRTEAEMQAELDGWLRRYVSDVENPDPALRARRPLRMAQLSIRDDSGDGTAYEMHLDLVPHTRFMSAEFSLSLDSRLGKR
jgi:type VI secretion system protein ImpC